MADAIEAALTGGLQSSTLLAKDDCEVFLVSRQDLVECIDLYPADRDILRSALEEDLVSNREGPNALAGGSATSMASINLADS